MKNNYEERKEARIEKYENLAEKNKNISNEKCNESIKMITALPLGQPILVGHHSEGKHRKLLSNSDNKMRQAVEAEKKAEYYERKAKGAKNNNSISSDDPEAVKKLKIKIERLEKAQEMMKAINKIVRSKKITKDEKVLKIIEVGITERQAVEIFEPDYLGRIGFPRFRLTNNNATIKNAKKRLEQLQEIESMESKETEYGEITIIESVEKNRVQIIFPGKPSDEVRKELKSNGFRWSPTENAWQAFLKQWNVVRAHNIAKNNEGLEQCQG